MLVAPGFLAAQKGIIGSQLDEKQFINNLYQSGQSSVGGKSSNYQWRAAAPMNAARAPIISVVESSDGGEQVVSKKKPPLQGKKKFQAEEGRGKSQKRGYAGAQSPNMKKYSRGGDGVKKVTKNNYFDTNAN